MTRTWIDALLHYNFAGGSPAASHFLLLRQEKVTKEKATQARRPVGSLRCSPGQAAAELALAAARQGLRQSSPTAPDLAVLLGGSHGGYCFAPGHLLKYPAPTTRFPYEPPSSANGTGEVGEHCLSLCRHAAKASCAAARSVEQRRAARRAGESGRHFLWLADSRYKCNTI